MIKSVVPMLTISLFVAYIAFLFIPGRELPHLWLSLGFLLFFLVFFLVFDPDKGLRTYVVTTVQSVKPSKTNNVCYLGVLNKFIVS